MENNNELITFNTVELTYNPDKVIIKKVIVKGIEYLLFNYNYYNKRVNDYYVICKENGFKVINKETNNKMFEYFITNEKL